MLSSNSSKIKASQQHSSVMSWMPLTSLQIVLDKLSAVLICKTTAALQNLDCPSTIPKAVELSGVSPNVSSESVLLAWL